MTLIFFKSELFKNNEKVFFSERKKRIRHHPHTIVDDAKQHKIWSEWQSPLFNVQFYLKSFGFAAKISTYCTHQKNHRLGQLKGQKIFPQLVEFKFFLQAQNGLAFWAISEKESWCNGQSGRFMRFVLLCILTDPSSNPLAALNPFTENKMFTNPSCQ